MPGGEGIGVGAAAGPRLIEKSIIGAREGMGAGVGAGARVEGAEGARLRGKVEVELEEGAEIEGLGLGASIHLEGAGGATLIGKTKVEAEREGGGTAEAAEIGAGPRLTTKAPKAEAGAEGIEETEGPAAEAKFIGNEIKAEPEVGAEGRRFTAKEPKAGAREEGLGAGVAGAEIEVEMEARSNGKMI